MPRLATVYVEGSSYTHPIYGKFTIVDRVNKYNVYIEFERTGYRYKTSTKSIKELSVVDRNHPSVCGVGFNGGPVKKRLNAKAYSDWNNMLRRCYDPANQDYHNYGGRGVTVCKEWHNFQNFLFWFNDNYIEGYHIDKDINGSEEEPQYSPDTCKVVSPSVNANNKRYHAPYDLLHIETGVRYTGSNLKAFCRQQGLPETGDALFHAVLKDSRKTAYGYKKYDT